MDANSPRVMEQLRNRLRTLHTSKDRNSLLPMNKRLNRFATSLGLSAAHSYFSTAVLPSTIPS